MYVNGRPKELIAVSSDCSDSFPVNIIDANKTASGSARGIRVMVEYHSNSIIILHSNPLPIKSSIYFHRNCIKRITSTTENVKKKGLIKEEKINFLKMFNSKKC